MTTWRVTHLVWRDSWMSHDAHKCVCMRVCISFGGCIYHWNIIESVSSDIDILLFSAWKQKRLYNHLQVWAYNSIAKLRCVRVCHGALFFFSFFFSFSLMYTSLPYASANANWRVLCMCIVRCAWIEMHAFALHLSDQISKCRYSVSVIHGNPKPLNLQHPNGLSFPGVFDLAIYYCTCMYCIPIYNHTIHAVLICWQMRYTHTYRMKCAGKCENSNPSISSAHSDCFVAALLMLIYIKLQHFPIAYTVHTRKKEEFVTNTSLTLTHTNTRTCTHI